MLLQRGHGRILSGFFSVLLLLSCELLVAVAATVVAGSFSDLLDFDFADSSSMEGVFGF